MGGLKPIGLGSDSICSGLHFLSYVQNVMGLLGWSVPPILHELSYRKLSEKSVWLVACLHERMQFHESIQAGGIRLNQASLLGLADGIQDEGDGPMCQSHRLNKLHPLI